MKKTKWIEERRKQEKNFNKFLYVFIVALGFTFAFVLLIDKQQKDQLADIRNETFYQSTITGKQIVAKDLDTIYPKYYIALFMGNDYIIHAINYYQTDSQFNLDFSRDTYTIRDYDRSQKMIRNEIMLGNGIYNDVLANFGSIIGVDHIEII